MKKVILLCLLYTGFLNAQFFDLKDKDIVFKTVNKSQIFKVNDLKFIVTWDEKLIYSNNLGSYGVLKN